MSDLEVQRAVAKLIEKFPIRLLGGLPITVISRSESAQNFAEHALLRRDRELPPFYSTSANGQVLSMCASDAEIREEFLKADEIVADGMPMVAASRIRKGFKLPERVATTDLIHDAAQVAVERDLTFFMLGADETSNRLTVENLQAKYPKLRIIGRRDGYFGIDDEDAIIAELNKLKPDIVWIAMGVPREQQFISRNLEKMTGVGVLKTSGGLFDFLSGKRSRAPRWMQLIGLEWAYRAILEPKRLGKRYIETNPHALRLLFTKSN